jgi:Ger(x)C family germination protein
MKLMRIANILLCVCLISGCYNYKDIDEIIFTTAIILDEDDKGNIVAYQELFKSYRGSGQDLGKEVRVQFIGKGRTIYEALINTSIAAGDEVDDSQIRALIITEKAAKKGLDKYIDYFVRSQKPTVRMHMFIYEGDKPEDLLNLKIPEEEFLGLFLHSMMLSQESLLNIQAMKLNDYSNDRVVGSKTTLIPIIKQDDIDNKTLEVRGAAIFKKDKLVGKLSREELFYYNITHKDETTGVIVVERPKNKGLVSLKVLDSKVKFNILKNGKDFKINKKVEMTVSLIENEYSDFSLNSKTVKEIEKEAEKQLEKGCTKVFKKYQEKGIDIYNLTRQIYRKYPNINKNKAIDQMKLGTVNVKITIEGSQNRTDFE